MRNFYYQVSAQATGTGTGTIVGQVTDPSGAVVPKATVTLTNAATGSYNLKRTADELRGFAFPTGWKDVPGVRSRRAIAVDASSYFSGPGPRPATGVFASAAGGKRPERWSR